MFNIVAREPRSVNDTQQMVVQYKEVYLIFVLGFLEGASKFLYVTSCKIVPIICGRYLEHT